MAEIAELVARIRKEFRELDRESKSSDVEDEKKNTLTALNKVLNTYESAEDVESVARIVFCGWNLAKISDDTKAKLCCYREDQLTTLLVNGLEEGYMKQAIQLKDHLFGVEVAGKDDGVRLQNLINPFAKRVKTLIQEGEQEIINSYIPGVTCKQVLDEVKAKCTAEPKTPFLEIGGDNLLRVKQSPTDMKDPSSKDLQVQAGAGVITLERWLNSDDTNVMEYMTIPKKAKKASYLSNDFKKIMRSVGHELRVLHALGFIHGKLSQQTIFIKHDLSVVLSPSCENGDLETDFTSLKEIVKSALAGHLKDCPADLYHFLNQSTRNLMYFHPAFWSPYDMIYMVDQLAAALVVERDIVTRWCRNLPNDILGVLDVNLAEFEFLNQLYNKHASVYKAWEDKERPLAFMRDSNHHVDYYVKERSDSAEMYILRMTTMTQLACPTYIACLMQVIVDVMDQGKIGKSRVVKDAVFGHFKL